LDFICYFTNLVNRRDVFIVTVLQAVVETWRLQRCGYMSRPTWNAIDVSLYPVTLLFILDTCWWFLENTWFWMGQLCVCVVPYWRAALSFQHARLGYSVQNVGVITSRDVVFVCETIVSCSDFTQTVLFCGHSGKINMVHFKQST